MRTEGADWVSINKHLTVKAQPNSHSFGRQQTWRNRFSLWTLIILRNKLSDLIWSFHCCALLLHDMTKASEDGRTTLTQSHRQCSGSDPMMTIIADQLYDLIISRKRHYSLHVPTTWLTEMSTFRYALHGPSLHRATLCGVDVKKSKKCQKRAASLPITVPINLHLTSSQLVNHIIIIIFPRDYYCIGRDGGRPQKKWSDFLLTEIFARLCFFCCCYDAMINCLRFFSHWVLAVG